MTMQPLLSTIPAGQDSAIVDINGQQLAVQGGSGSTVIVTLVGDNNGPSNANVNDQATGNVGGVFPITAPIQSAALAGGGNQVVGVNNVGTLGVASGAAVSAAVTLAGDVSGPAGANVANTATGNVAGVFNHTSPISANKGAGTVPATGSVRLPAGTVAVGVMQHGPGGTDVQALTTSAGIVSTDALVVGDGNAAGKDTIMNGARHYFAFLAQSQATQVVPAAISGTSGQLVANGIPGTAAFNTAWYAVTDIYWDPAGTAGGSDANTGTTIGSPLLTFKEIVNRYGSSTPQFNYGQSVTVHQLTSQPAAQDPVFFAPYVSGGGAAVLLGTLILSGGASSSVNVTAKARGGPGTLLQITNFGALAQKQLVFNSTRGSYAFVDGTTSPFAMTQPLSSTLLSTVGVPTLAEDNTWTTGDTFQAYTLPKCNLKAWRPRGGDASASVVGGGWVQFVEIADSSGTGASEYPHLCDSGVNVLSSCLIDTRCHVATLNGRGQGAYLLGCYAAGQVVCFSGNPAIYGGTCAGGATVDAANPSLDGDLILHSASAFNACLPVVGAVYGDGTLQIEGGGATRVSTALWGSVAVTINPSSAYWNGSGTTFAATLLTNGALKLGANTTGSFFTPGTGLWTSAVNITPANLDTNNGLQNPQTGARFCNTS
jgi:hypothetical protein